MNYFFVSLHEIIFIPGENIIISIKYFTIYKYINIYRKYCFKDQNTQININLINLY